MAFLNTELFSFSSSALPPQTFGVVSFRGVEGLSQCYRFTIDLVSSEPELDLDLLISKSAVFTIHRADGDIPFHGVLGSLEQLQAFHEYVFYRAELIPRFYWLNHTFHNQVILDQAVPDFLTAVLKDGGLSTLDFEFRLSRTYTPWEYVCQYQESHFNFVSRWLEKEGFHYFFEQNQSQEKVILTDTALAHSPMPQGRIMRYAPPSGLDASRMEETIQNFICRRQPVPQSVMLKDYDYLKPSLELVGRAPVSPQAGRGQVFIYGDHFRTPEEGEALAKIRAEELLCRQTQFTGNSTIPFLRPGYTFYLENHYRGDFNRSYLTIGVEHQGNQAGYLVAGLQAALSEAEQEPFYRNSFTAIPADVQFRPRRQARQPRIHGTMNAWIDTSGQGKYAELDELGRYKVILPFDLSGRKDGKASTWLRMATPYAGSDHGMHFPLLKGTEVLLTFIDGDPDQPIIAAAVPNTATPSIIHSGNPTVNAIKTAGGNTLVMGDTEGQQAINLWSPFHQSGIFIGSTQSGGGGSLDFVTKGGSSTLVYGLSNTVTIGGKNTATIGSQNTASVGNSTTVNVGQFATLNFSDSITYNFDGVFGALTGNSYTIGGGKSYNLKRKATFAALDGITLAGGAGAAAKGVIAAAYGAIAAVMTASIIGVTGAGFIESIFSLDKDNKNIAPDTSWDRAKVGIIFAASAVSMALAAVLIRSAASAFDGMVSANQVAGVIKMNSGGVSIRASQVLTPATITLHSADLLGTSYSKQTMGHDNMVLITDDSIRESSLTLKANQAMITSKSNLYDDSCSLQLKHTLAKLWAETQTGVPGGAVTLTGTKLTLDGPGAAGALLEMKPQQFEMKIGTAGLKMSQTDLKISFGGGQTLYNTLGVNINGQVIKLG